MTGRQRRTARGREIFIVYDVQSDVFVFSGVSVAMMLKNVMKNCSLVRQEYKRC